MFCHHPKTSLPFLARQKSLMNQRHILMNHIRMQESDIRYSNGHQKSFNVKIFYLQSCQLNHKLLAQHTERTVLEGSGTERTVLEGSGFCCFISQKSKLTEFLR